MTVADVFVPFCAYCSFLCLWDSKNSEMEINCLEKEQKTLKPIADCTRTLPTKKVEVLTTRIYIYLFVS